MHGCMDGLMDGGWGRCFVTVCSWSDSTMGGVKALGLLMVAWPSLMHVCDGDLRLNILAFA